MASLEANNATRKYRIFLQCTIGAIYYINLQLQRCGRQENPSWRKIHELINCFTKNDAHPTPIHPLYPLRDYSTHRVPECLSIRLNRASHPLTRKRVLLPPLVPECLSICRNWAPSPHPRKPVCLPPGSKGGATLACW
jgi:hypothetical protein